MDFCLIFVPFGHYDEPEILRYPITSICPISADGEHAGTLANPYISGIWFGSTKLADSDDDNGGEGFDSRLSNFRVTEDGTYHIAVSHSGFPIGTYRLSVTETDLLAITKRNATDIEVDGGATGDIEQSGERDWFEIDLVGGNSYWIDIEGARTGAGTLRDPYLWGIYKADGTWIPGTEKNDGGVGYNTRLGFVPEEESYARFWVTA